MDPRDWTRAWTQARALLLVSWTRDPRALADARSRRLLELALAVAACRDGLRVHAHVILPGRIQVIGGLPSPIPWPRALGQLKAAHARWDARRRGLSRPRGSLWRPKVLVRPLASTDIERAVESLHFLPVREGLALSPSEWDASSWHDAGRRP